LEQHVHISGKAGINPRMVSPSRKASTLRQIAEPSYRWMVPTPPESGCTRPADALRWFATAVWAQQPKTLPGVQLKKCFEEREIANDFEMFAQITLKSNAWI
jgi:hypothetical protein